MSAKRILTSTAATIAILMLSGVHCGLAFAWTTTASRDAQNADISQSQSQPRDPLRNAVGPASSREQALQAAVSADPANVANWLELAGLQEARRALAAAERTYKAALDATGGTREVLTSLAGFFNRTGRFELTVETLERAAALNPSDPSGYHLLATHYFDKAQKDLSLTPADKLKYVDAGIGSTDRALAAKDDYSDAMVYKNILLRMKANLETDPVRRQALIAEADALRSRATELNHARGSAVTSPPSASAPPPPPPPPPPPADFYLVDGQQPIRSGKEPTKIRDVRPQYPQEALDAGVSGLVILEAVIDTQGNVRAARVLRSIPALDQAASDAVKQWRYEPTLLNGVPVPIVMTVTVNFTSR